MFQVRGKQEVRIFSAVISHFIFTRISRENKGVRPVAILRLQGFCFSRRFNYVDEKKVPSFMDEPCGENR